MPRKSLYPISSIFINRCSPRVMLDTPIKHEELMVLFEAARWTPSAHNEQPWRFIYTHKGSDMWNKLLALMVPGNQVWAKQAAVLVVLISKKTFERTGNFSNFHTFDTGAAWMSFALQGSISGLAVRAIAGFDYDQARTVLNIPPEFKIETMVAIGKPGEKEETKSDRKPLKDIIFEDVFK